MVFDFIVFAVILAIFAADAVGANLANRRSAAERSARHARY